MCLHRRRGKDYSKSTPDNYEIMCVLNKRWKSPECVIAIEYRDFEKPRQNITMCHFMITCHKWKYSMAVCIFILSCCCCCTLIDLINRAIKERKMLKAWCERKKKCRCSEWKLTVWLNEWTIKNRVHEKKQ